MYFGISNIIFWIIYIFGANGILNCAEKVLSHLSIDFVSITKLLSTIFINASLSFTIHIRRPCTVAFASDNSTVCWNGTAVGKACQTDGCLGEAENKKVLKHFTTANQPVVCNWLTDLSGIKRDCFYLAFIAGREGMANSVASRSYLWRYINLVCSLADDSKRVRDNVSQYAGKTDSARGRREAMCGGMIQCRGGKDSVYRESYWLVGENK